MTNVREILKPQQHRVLFFDLETLPNITVNWHPRQRYTARNQVLVTKTPFIAQWSWAHEKKIHTVSVLDDPDMLITPDLESPVCMDMYKSKHVINTIVEQINKADFVIGFNSDSFDIRYVKAESLKHGLSHVRVVRSIDLIKIIKKHFFLNYYSLDYVCDYFKLPRKLKTDQDMFNKAVQGDHASIEYLSKYGGFDVKLTKMLTEKVIDYVIDSMSQANQSTSIYRCANCDSSNLRNYGTYSSKEFKNLRKFCKDCGTVTRLKVPKDESFQIEFDIKI